MTNTHSNNYSKYIPELIEATRKIERDGWHESTRRGNTGIGKTFEDLLEKEEDNVDLPDFFDIEVKTHEVASKSLITLFTKAPSYPRGANTYLRENFGKIDEFGNKILHATVSGARKTNSKEYNYNFKTEVDFENRRIYLLVFDSEDDILVNNDVYWTFEDLQRQISRKLPMLAIVSAESKIEEGIKYYKYNKVDFLTDFSVDGLAKAIVNGDLYIDIRIGAYKTGKKKGKTHDHGTGFRINLEKLLNYGTTVEVDEV